LDGTTWSGDVDVGGRVACGVGRWDAGAVYLVTDETTQASDGVVESVAVPASW
jgi:hypothetical protein